MTRGYQQPNFMWLLVTMVTVMEISLYVNQEVNFYGKKSAHKTNTQQNFYTATVSLQSQGAIDCCHPCCQHCASYISHIILPTHLINIGRALYTNTSADTPAQFYVLVVPLWLVRVQIVFLNSL